MRTTTTALFLVFAVLWGIPSSAERIYTSRDKNGTLVFSDKPMQGSRVLSVRQVEVTKGSCVSIDKRGDDDNRLLRAINDCYGPVEVRTTRAEAVNVSTNRPASFTILVPERSSKDLIQIERVNPRRGYKYSFTHSMIFGDPRAQHQPPTPYLLPVPPGQSFPVSQGFHGRATHTHPQSEYAVDIPMPEGTRLYAVRSGVIMDIANDFFTGGKGEKFEERANFIRILHADGTMALYAHLKVESIQYPTGTRVSRGQFIAESGNTGYSSGPHLHFAIQKNFGGELRSIPFEFEDRGGSGFTPEMGMMVAR